VYCTLLVVSFGNNPICNAQNGTFMDVRDQHVYKYVKIGTQTWMAENLAYLPAVSPSSDGSESSAFYYVYNYEGSSISEAKSQGNYTSYGVLYNWEAAKIACPSGWYLPSGLRMVMEITAVGLTPFRAATATTTGLPPPWLLRRLLVGLRVRCIVRLVPDPALRLRCCGPVRLLPQARFVGPVPPEPEPVRRRVSFIFGALSPPGKRAARCV